MALRGPRSPAPNHCNNTNNNTSQKQAVDLQNMVLARLGTFTRLPACQTNPGVRPTGTLISAAARSWRLHAQSYTRLTHSSNPEAAASDVWKASIRKTSSLALPPSRCPSAAVTLAPAHFPTTNQWMRFPPGTLPSEDETVFEWPKLSTR